jgi:hypothetical protein
MAGGRCCLRGQRWRTLTWLLRGGACLPRARPPDPLRPARAQADVEAIRGALLQRRGALVNLTADGGALAAAGPQVASFLDALPGGGAADADWAAALPRRNEAICVPTQARARLLFKTLQK